MAGSDGSYEGHARDVAINLLALRAPGAAICPSEVAKALAGGAQADWRAMMPCVHAAIDGLVGDGIVRLSWKGKALATRAGPYRIGRGARD